MSQTFVDQMHNALFRGDETLPEVLVPQGGKGGRGKSRPSSTPISKSRRAGLSFPVGRVTRLLREGRYAPRISAGCGVYMASVLEYLAAELLELAGNAAKDNKRTRITPRHILLGLRNDSELTQLVGNNATIIAGGGVLPNIHKVLLKDGKMKKKKTTEKKKNKPTATPPSLTSSSSSPPLEPIIRLDDTPEDPEPDPPAEVMPASPKQ
jgi:histone H2A